MTQQTRQHKDQSTTLDVGSNATRFDENSAAHQLYDAFRAQEPVTYHQTTDTWLVTSYDAAIAVTQDSEHFQFLGEARWSPSPAVSRVESSPNESGSHHDSLSGSSHSSAHLHEIRAAITPLLDRQLTRLTVQHSVGTRTDIAAELARPIASHLVAHLKERGFLTAALGRTSGHEDLDVMVEQAAIEHAVVNAITTLQAFPSQRQALEADTSFVPSAVEELLRWSTPHLAENYVVRGRVTISGVQLDEGANLSVLTAAVNHDPSRWSDPHLFDVTRDPQPHLAARSQRLHKYRMSPSRHVLQVLLEALAHTESAKRWLANTSREGFTSPRIGNYNSMQRAA